MDKVKQFINSISDDDKIRCAIKELLFNGGSDGSHHKQHTIDQTLRILCGEYYDDLIQLFCFDGDEQIYDWDMGVP